MGTSSPICPVGEFPFIDLRFLSLGVFYPVMWVGKIRWFLFPNCKSNIVIPFPTDKDWVGVYFAPIGFYANFQDG